MLFLKFSAVVHPGVPRVLCGYVPGSNGEDLLLDVSDVDGGSTHTCMVVQEPDQPHPTLRCFGYGFWFGFLFCFKILFRI